MVSELQATDIPCDRVDALHILALNDDDLTNLSSDQITALRALYFLDSDMSIEQRLRDGSILTDGMERETKAINTYGRDDL